MKEMVGVVILIAQHRNSCKPLPEILINAAA